MDSETTLEGPGDELIAHVYQELRGLAHARLRSAAMDRQTLQPTALVHEAYMRLMKHPDKIWRGRRHFYRAAALAMRHILVERMRSRLAHRRGGAWQRVDITITLIDRSSDLELSPENFLTLNQVLTRLQREYPGYAEIVLMRYFCGLTIAEIADIQNLSTRTIERKWCFARAWLGNELKDTPVGCLYGARTMRMS